MTAQFTALMILAMAFVARPALAQHSYCPAGIEVPSSAIEEVDDIFHIRAQHPGEQVNFNEVALPNADFSGRDVSNLCFNRSVLAQSNWSGATADSALFSETDLSGSIWHRFRGRGLKFYGSNLDGANLVHAVLRDTTFGGNRMEGLDASYADLSGGSLTGSALDSMHQAVFDHANLTGFEICCGIGQSDNCGQRSSEVSLVGADLTGAAILMAAKHDWDLSGARIDNTRLHFFQLDWIRESQMDGPVTVLPTPWSPSQYFSDLLTRVVLSATEVRLVWRAFDRLKEPGFNCDNSLTPSEQYICIGGHDSHTEPFDGPSQFAEADRELNQAYVLAQRKDRSIAAQQRLWLNERDTCMQQETGWPRDHCIRTAYSDRIDELWQIAGMEATLAAGERQLFVDQQTGEFLWEIESTELRAKMISVALGNSWEIIVFERESNDRIKATGSGIGTNYHLGDLHSPENGMEYDPVSGFYGGREHCIPRHEGIAEFKICPIVRIRGRYLDVGPEMVTDQETNVFYFNNYIMTGARAGFGRLVALPAGEG